MSERASVRRKKPVVLISLFVVLALLTIAGICGVAYGFYTGWLTPYWTNLSDAHASVLAQLIFFFGAAWAAVLVPLLFGEQLQNLQDAAQRAEDTYAEIRSRMETTAAESEAQLKKIVRLQMMSVGHLLDEQLKFLETADEKDEFVDSRWDRASTRIDEAVAALHGNVQNSIKNAGIRRSNEWWDKLRAYGVLGEFHDDFKTLSHISRKAKQNLHIDDLRDSNNASRKIESFDPAVARQRAAPPANNAPTQASVFIPPSSEPPATQLPQ